MSCRIENREQYLGIGKQFKPMEGLQTRLAVVGSHFADGTYDSAEWVRINGSFTSYWPYTPCEDSSPSGSIESMLSPWSLLVGPSEPYCRCGLKLERISACSSIRTKSYALWLCVPDIQQS